MGIINFIKVNIYNKMATIHVKADEGVWTFYSYNWSDGMQMVAYQSKKIFAGGKGQIEANASDKHSFCVHVYDHRGNCLSKHYGYKLKLGRHYTWDGDDMIDKKTGKELDYC